MCVEKYMGRKTLKIDYLELLDKLISIILNLFKKFFNAMTLYPLLNLLTKLIQKA